MININDYNKDDIIASCLIESVEILSESLSKDIRKEVKEGLNGKYDNVIIDNEKKLNEFMDKYGDDIKKNANAIKDDIKNKNSKKFSKSKLFKFAITFISFLTGIGIDSITNPALRTRKRIHMLEGYTNGVNYLEEVFNKKPWTSAYMNELFERSVSGARSPRSIEHLKKVTNVVYGRRVAIIIVAISALVIIINHFIHVKDKKELEENIKYLKMIKRKLTQDLPKIEDEKIYTKYKILIEKINRAEDEYNKNR